MSKVLIIKLGYTETLDNSLSLTTSLGDVLRTTFVLNFFKSCDVSWLVDEKAIPLLEDNPHINRILAYNQQVLDDLKKERFDIIVNFEKLPEVYKVVNFLDCNKCFGFGFHNGSSAKSSGGRRLIELSQDVDKRRANKDCWQKVLSESLGEEWKGERYILGYKPRTEVVHDIGFNWQTSAKWKNKPWPLYCWRELERLIGGKYSVSWQQGLDSLYEYIDWINSCRLIVTGDSLGLHLSLALSKRVIALFGPTSHTEINFYNCGTFILPESPYNCIPCLKPVCDRERPCMEYIFPEMVKDKIEDELKTDKPASAL